MKEERQTEARFVSSCKAIGYYCEKTDYDTDMCKHIDFWVTRPNGKVGVDIKGSYKGEVWVEFKNVNGHDGSLYGMADYIAFDFQDKEFFGVVSRNELAKYCEQNVEDIFVSKDEAYKKKYTREGRKDVITKISLADLESLNTYKKINYEK